VNCVLYLSYFTLKSLYVVVNRICFTNKVKFDILNGLDSL